MPSTLTRTCATCTSDYAAAAIRPRPSSASGLRRTMEVSVRLGSQRSRIRFEFISFYGRLILDSGGVMGQFWRNRLFLQTFHGGRDRGGIIGKSLFISRAY